MGCDVVNDLVVAHFPVAELLMGEGGIACFEIHLDSTLMAKGFQTPVVIKLPG